MNKNVLKTAIIFILVLLLGNATFAVAVNEGISSIDGFSETQGANGWSYLEWNGSEYIEMKYSADQAVWKGSAEFCLIGNSWQHPHTVDSVRAFTAPETGKVRILASIIRNDSQGDGTNVKIMKNNEQIWPENGWKLITDRTPVDIAVEISINKGDIIYFIANMNGEPSYDGLEFPIRITYTEITSTKAKSNENANKITSEDASQNPKTGDAGTMIYFALAGVSCLAILKKKSSK